MTSQRSGRRPGSPDTRGAILDAARALFAERGYERTTIRSVARRAGVDPALVHHYFGTKADLLAEAVQLPIDPRVVLAGVAEHPETAGFEIARRVLGAFDANPAARSTMMALVRAAMTQPAAAAAVRSLFTATVHAELQRLVTDDTSQLRASLISAHMGGLFLGRYIIGFPGLAQTQVDALAAAIAPALQHYVTGDIAAPPPAGPAPEHGPSPPG